MLAPAELGRVIVVLVAPRNPNNIGAAARAMSNFGFPHLRIVSTYDLPFHEARSAVGAAYLLAAAQQCATLEEAIADCSLVVGTTAVGGRELQHPLYRLEAAGSLIRAFLGQLTPVPNSNPGRIALLFGSEKTGLSREDLSRCHWLLRIPTREEHRSMNLGQAVALTLYELVRQPELQSESHLKTSQPQPAQPRSARAADLDRLTKLLLEAVEASGYLKPNPDAAAQQKIRRLILRLNPSADDAEILLGVLRQFLWKVARNASGDK